MSTFEVTTRTESADGVVVVHGDVDLATADRLFAAAEEAMNATPGRLIVDLAGVTFIDSTGLGALIRLRNALVAGDRQLTIESPSRTVERAMSLAGLSEIFGVPVAD